MKKSLILLVFLFYSLTSWGQIEYNKIKEQAESWYNSVVSEELLPKGAKNKTVEYPEFHYCISGYYSKDILTEGQIVEIYYTDSNPLLVLRGKVTYLANRLLVKGIKYDYSEKGDCSTYGAFYVSNTPDNLMSYKPKKALAINISPMEIEYYLGYYLDNPTAVRVKDDPWIAIEGRGGKYSYNDFSAPLEESSIKRIGYDNVYNLLLSVSKNAMMHWNNGFYKDFKGTVSPRERDEGRVYFDFLTGIRTGFESGHKTIRVYEDFGKLCMEMNDDPESPLIRETIVVSDLNVIGKDSYWDLRTFLENLSEIRWEYRNGDTFVGNATFSVTPSADGSGESLSETITTGKYTYSNGDYFVGDMSKGFVCGFPIAGMTYFINGTKAEGNWLGKYQLTEEQWAKVSSSKCPSDALRMAVRFQDELLYDKYMTEASKAAKGMHYEEARSYYLAAKEIKPDAEKWDDIIKELDKQIYLKTRRETMIARYGSTYGPKIAEGIVELGMTKAMVTDAFGIDDVLLHAFRVSFSIDWDDSKIETWEYDYDRVKRYMDKEMGDDAASFNLLMGLGSALGYNFRSEVSKNIKYKYLRFRNDKLIELKDSSFYDDIDNATDDINSSLWMLNGL